MEDVPLSANVLSIYQLELIKEGDHNFQVFARQEVKNVESMSNRVKMRRRANITFKDRNVNISKGKMKDGSRAQVNWNEKFQGSRVSQV